MATARTAFSSLSSFITSLDPSVPVRGMVLYNTAVRKTRPGSGRELGSDVAGNHTGIAAACLMLAQIEAQGPSEVNQADYQRLSSINPNQYKKLIETLKGVLELQGRAGEVSTTPTRSGSARKRKISLVDVDDEQDDPLTTTPTKSSKKATPASLSASRNTPTKPTASTSTTRTTPRSARVEELSRGKVTGSRKDKMEEDMDLVSVENDKSPTRRSTRTAPSSSGSGSIGAMTVVGSGNKKTPTKASASKALSRSTPTMSAAFEKALSVPTSRPTTTPTKAKPSTPFKAITTQPKVPEIEEQEIVQEVPYETYADDMLLRWRRKERVKKMMEGTERWRLEILERLEVQEELRR